MSLADVLGRRVEVAIRNRTGQERVDSRGLPTPLASSVHDY